jgi:uncharacterized protein with HEPN domain
MNRSDLDRLRDARAYAQHALSNTAGLRAEALARAIQSQHAALYDLVIIGETLHRVSAEIKGAAPAMEWRGYSDLRNYIVHSYWQIDFEIVAEIIRTRLAPLVAELDTLIAFVERSER